MAEKIQINFIGERETEQKVAELSSDPAQTTERRSMCKNVV